MIKTTAIKLVKSEPMMVTWDLGRRCNYDCTYCESTRHNNYSKHRTFDELKGTLDFIKKYSALYGHDKVNVNFTGGEPTVNPDFWKLTEHINKHNNFNLSLTTNGAWAVKRTKAIVRDFKGITVSYHAEADPLLRDRVIENILALHDSRIWLQVNVMLHTDHWDHCVAIYEKLKSYGIKTNARPIGDGIVERAAWFVDSDGSMRRTSHSYSLEQQQWFFDQMKSKGDPQQIREGTQLGRACCGGRCMEGKVDNVWQPVNLIDTNFKDWYCSVNKYFLHIDNETELVYHHQTCQAKFEKKRGSIGSLTDTESIYRYVEQNKNNTIICPNQRCGCGMCVPKAQTKEDYDLLFSRSVSC